jgi:hypothetical protein
VVVDEATPKIRENALRGMAGETIRRSIYANAIDTLIPVALALLLAWNGLDVIGRR